MAAYDPAYYAANREKILARNRAWKAANKGNERTRRATLRGTLWRAIEGSRREAKRGGYAPIVDTVDELVTAWKDSTQTCWMCGFVPAPDHVLHGLHVDHDHETGRFRAFLCRACNHREAWARRHLSKLHELWGMAA